MKTKLTSLPIAAVCAALLIASLLSLRAGTLYVTTTADSGAGSLRGALGFAGNGDIIDATGVVGTITLTSGQLAVPTSVTILGPGPATLTVNGNHASRVFSVTGTNVLISGLTISNGYTTASGVHGAGIYAGGPAGSRLTLDSCVVTNNNTTQNGGGIFNDLGRTLAVTNCMIRGNSAYRGGGIFNHASASNAMVLISASTVSANRATDRGAGIYNNGYSGGNATLILDDSTVMSNAANWGGGIFNDGYNGNATVTNYASTLSGNTANNDGGGIYSDGRGSGRATVTIEGGTVSSNTAAANGGGIWNNGEVSLGATLSISDCLLYANRATGWGGAIFNDGAASGGHATLLLNACTLSNNWTANGGGGVFNDGLSSGSATLTVTNCLFSGNWAYSGAGIHNRGNSGTATMTMESSALNGNLAYNGGAIYSEGQNPSTMMLTICSSTLSGNSATNNGGAIYNNGLNNGAISVTITNSLITDNWATNWGGGIYNHSLSANAQVTISGSTVSNNTAFVNGGGIYNNGTQSSNKVLNITGSALISNLAGSFGGGIFNTNAAVTVTISTLTDNSAQIGGAILNSGNLAVMNSQITDNLAQGAAGQTPGAGSNGGGGGGGAGLGGAIFSDGILLLLTNSVFTGNSAAGGQGGNGLHNRFGDDPGGKGGGPFGGLGGTVGHAGSAGGYGSGGGGGAGSSYTGYAGGAGGFGGGGGGGGARGASGSGGLGGIGGAYGGYGANALYSTSGGGGGGAGLGGAVFVRAGAATVVSCSFTGNLATNGLAGASYYGYSGQGVGGALFSMTTNVLAQENSFSNNAASTYAPDVDMPFLVVTLADGVPGSLRQVLASATNGATITFDVAGTITLTNGPLNVSSNVTLLGPGPSVLTVSGNNTTNVFNVTGTNVTISGLTIANGYSSSGAGGAGINAAASSGSRITLNNCVITNNHHTAYDGGGIYNSPGVTMVLSNCTVYGNSASNTFGGGIYNRQGVLNIVSSTLSGNAALRGGAIYNDGGSSSATLTIANSTLSGNTAVNWGGAVFNDGSSSPATNKINSSTLSGNSASQGGAIYSYGASSRAEIGDTIFNVGTGSGGTLYNPSGTVKSDGYNLSSDAAGGDGTTSPGGFLNGTNDVRNTNPLLGPLQDNGGLTWTHALMPDSPAMDKGKRNAVTNLVSTADQRGLARSVDFSTVANASGGDGSDIGAFEFQHSTLVTVTNDSGPGCLREAIAGGANGDTITFASSLSGATILLTNGQIAWSKSLNIDASALPAGIIINGNYASRIFQVGSGGPVMLNSLTITNGIDIGGGNQGGGGILNYGTLTLHNCTLVGNSATTTWGGGGILSYNGVLTINQSTVSGNAANVKGGGIVSYLGTLTLLSSTLSGNSASTGGGVYISSGSATIRNTILNAGASGANVVGSGSSGGYNLSSDNSGIGFLNQTGDQNNTDPQLGPLQDNGGPTWTHALLPGSPAIDAGDDSVLPLLPTDQRGFLRKSGGHVDIGAYELQMPTVTSPWLTGLSRSSTGTVQFSFTNTPGAIFTVLTTTNLALPASNWMVISNLLVESPPGFYQFTDSFVTTDPQRYYLVRWP